LLSDGLGGPKMRRSPARYRTSADYQIGTGQVTSSRRTQWRSLVQAHEKGAAP